MIVNKSEEEKNENGNVSQPMAGKTDEEIAAVREKAG